MKSLAWCCAAVALSASVAPAAAPQGSISDSVAIKHYHGVLFEKIIGGIKRFSPTDKIETCQIKTDDAAVKERLVELAGLIDKAAQQPMTEAFHFVAQIPSIEIFATHISMKDKESQELKTERILLVRDYETLHTRKGPETEDLLKLINDLCPNPSPPPPKKSLPDKS